MDFLVDRDLPVVLVLLLPVLLVPSLPSQEQKTPPPPVVILDLVLGPVLERVPVRSSMAEVVGGGGDVLLGVVGGAGGRSEPGGGDICLGVPGGGAGILGGVAGLGVSGSSNVLPSPSAERPPLEDT